MERMKDMSSTAMSAPHTLVIEDRKRLSVSGVTDVESFDEETVALATELGELIIHGYDLHRCGKRRSFFGRRDHQPNLYR